MKLHFKPTSKIEGLPTIPLDLQSIRMEVELVLFDGEKPNYLLQPDGSLILEMERASEDTRADIIRSAEWLCAWGDMQFEELK